MRRTISHGHNTRALLDAVVRLAQCAGDRVLALYDTHFNVDYKEDGSPLTEADMAAHHIISAGLAELTPDIPVLSEESPPATVSAIRDAKRLWLVDPVDGTEQFVKRNGEFTVNIGLIENGAPVLGVVHTPVRALTHYAARDHGAFLIKGNAAPQPIRVRPPHPDHIVALVSHRYSDPRQQSFLDNIQAEFNRVRHQILGSSLKFCLIAEGVADVYYRTRPTMEWDTAAAQCVVEVAGGTVTTTDGKPLRYNKKSLFNPHFIATGGDGERWRQLIGLAGASGKTT